MDESEWFYDMDFHEEIQYPEDWLEDGTFDDTDID